MKRTLALIVTVLAGCTLYEDFPRFVPPTVDQGRDATVGTDVREKEDVAEDAVVDVLPDFAVEPSANLSSITIIPGNLEPSFSQETESYFISIPWEATEIAVSGKTFDPMATVTLNGDEHEGEVSIPILPEQVIELTFEVIARDRTTTRTYEVVVQRQELPRFATQSGYIKASNADVDDAFGSWIDAEGELLVVTAIGESSGAFGINGDEADNSGSGSLGAGYIFRRGPTGWVQEAYIKGHEDRDTKISRLAVDRGTVVSTASGDGPNGEAVWGYITRYESVNDVWQVDRRIQMTTAGFLGAIDADNNRIAVGFDASNAPQNVLVFQNLAVLDTVRPVENSTFFGFEVALSRDLLIVSDIVESSSSTGVDSTQNTFAEQSGASWIFTRNGTQYEQEAYLKASNTDEDDRFGRSLDIAPGIAIVGAPFEDSFIDESDNDAEDSGAAYIFENGGNGWRQTAFLKGRAMAGEEIAGDRFGWSVSIVDSRTVVVTSREDDSAASGFVSPVPADSQQGPDSGAAFIFEKADNGTWNLTSRLRPMFPQSGSECSNVIASTSFNGPLVFLGCNQEASSARGIDGPQDDVGASNSGAVFVFD